MLSVTNVAVYANETAEYKVRYVEEGTDNDLIYPKVVTNKQVGEVVTEVAPNIDGATLVSKECKNLVAGEEDLILKMTIAVLAVRYLNLKPIII